MEDSPTGASQATSGQATESKAEDNGVAPAAGPEPADTGKKQMKRSTRIALSIIGALALLAALGFGGAYFLYSRNFVTTDNAQIDGDKIQINAPTTGTLVNWRVTQGTEVKKDQVLGRIEALGSFAQPQRVIKSPGDGTVAVNNGIEGSYVNGGSQLATAYDFSKIFATARVDETDVGDVQVGALVDIDVDAFSGAKVTGVVQEIQGAAADQFSLFPESNSTGNFQKVTQVIPVKILLLDTGGAAVAPGMNITVHIHKK
ncbi:HlyD family efflux transporter periplasmic adaptor subunit [Pseudonocardia eucalypti]|uniref:HlyD family efflux transporter periplasmic adaptor subunit n=1 Tax=Pseudonocardia eucalypti TaxID=648755 RepID=A0ABP9R9Y8_9PSEU|nr:multidrug resistance efflux pump [Pseudonocardia eucalypti]